MGFSREDSQNRLANGMMAIRQEAMTLPRFASSAAHAQPRPFPVEDIQGCTSSLLERESGKQ